MRNSVIITASGRKQESFPYLMQPLKKGFRLLSFTEDFPQITQWKMMGERDYVLGLEPCTNTLEGRSEIRRRKELPLLPPGESRTFSVQVKLFNSSSQWEASL